MSIPIHVLILEDNPADAELMVYELCRAGFEPDWKRVETEPDYLAHLSSGLDLILADYNLPQFDGLRALHLLQARELEIPFIIVSGAIGEELAVSAIKGGAADYLIKDRLARLGPAVVRALLERKLRLEKRQAEQQLHLQAAALESAANAIVITDREGAITWVNPAFTRLTGYTTEEAIGQNPRFLKSGKHDLPFYQNFWKTVLSGQAWHGEIINRRKDGLLYTEEQTITPVQDENGEITHFIGIKQDITDGKWAKEALRESEELYRSLVESAPDIIFTLTPDGAIASLNAAFETITGWPREEGLGKPFMSIVHRDDLPGMIELFQRILLNERVPPTAVRILQKSGNYVFIEATAIPLPKNGQQVVGVLGIARDITKRVRADEALQESNRCLEEVLAELKATQQHIIQQERLHALGTMASGVAHDFNNALSPIMGFSEMLLNHPEMLDDKERVMHYLTTVNIAARDAANVVRHLREFYRPREANENFQPVDLNQLVGGTISLTQPKWKNQAQAKGIAICLKKDLQHIPLIAGVEAELREVLTNLIFNSVDSMPDGGTITLRTCTDGVHVTLEVIDTGMGMTEEVRQRCLEPFFSTKGEGGTGLGLAMAYGIIQRHSGTIAIESELGVGTTVRIRLPLPKGHRAIDIRRMAGTLLGPLHVLVVDDEPLVSEIIAEYLTGDGHTVETATDGWDALEKFQKGWFDLVITDQAMPGMSGDQLAGVIKRIAPTKPIILLTGFGDLMNESGEKSANLDFIVSKPITLSMFRDVLTQVNSSVLR